MKKYIIITASLFLGLSVAQAQPNTAQDSVDIEVDGNKITLQADDIERLSALDLNKMIKEVVEKTAKIKKQQSLLMERVERQEKTGEITEEQAEEMREDINERTGESMEVIGEMMEVWGESYGERWEAWADEYEAKMEAWENQVEAREDGIAELPPLPPLPPLPAMPEAGEAPAAPNTSAPADTNKKKKQKIVISEDGITIEPGEEGDQPFAFDFDKNKSDNNKDNDVDSYDRSEDYSYINFGLNQLLEDGQFQVIDEPAEQELWNSYSVDFGFGYKTRLGSPYSKLYLNWGGEFSWHNFRLAGNNVIQKQQGAGIDDAVTFVNDTTRNISKSRFEIVYFNIPVMLQLDFSDVGRIDDSFTLGVGGYGGVRLTSRQRLEYKDFEGSDVEFELKNNFFTNRFHYGLMAQAGWEDFKITARYDLSSFFESDKDLGKDYQMASVSLGWTF